MSDLAFAESFLERFAVPLVSGQKVHVGTPLGAAGAGRLRAAIAEGLDATRPGQALQLERQEALLPLLAEGPPPLLADDGGAIFVLAALHDLLFLVHPESGRLDEERLAVVARVALSLCAQATPDSATAPPTSVSELLQGRHSLLGRLDTLGREDVQRKGAGGQAVQIYRGVAPPRRWLGLSDAADEVKRTLVLPELLSACDGLGAELLRGLLFASPLTALLWLVQAAPQSAAPSLELFAQSGWLRFAPVARLVVRRCFELGLSVSGAALATRLMQELQTGAMDARRREGLSRWLCLLGHLHVTAHVIAENPLPPASSPSPLLDFYGLYAALYRQRPELMAPLSMLRDPLLRPRVKDHAQRCQTLAGPTRTRKLAELLGEPHANVHRA
jgi:hypothetical protein